MDEYLRKRDTPARMRTSVTLHAIANTELQNILEATLEHNGIWPLLNYAMNSINGVKEFVAGRISAAVARFER
jgi:hypothetical protein